MSTDSELVEHKTSGLAPSPVVKVETPSSELQTVQMSPIEIMRQAKETGLTVEEMREMLVLQKDYEANEALKAFHQALAEFKKNPPQVVKDKLNTQYDSNYTSIGNMVNTVNEALGEHGLNARWDFPSTEDKEEIICTCILAHRLGHEESVTLSGPVDTSGSKNPLQGRKSARTYLKLETFEAVTGVASVEGNLDDDGNATGPVAFIEPDQIAEIEAKINELGQDVTPRFLKFMRINDLAEIDVRYYGNAINFLNNMIDNKPISESDIADLEALISEVGADRDGFLKACRVSKLEELPVHKLKPAIEKLEAKRKES